MERASDVLESDIARGLVLNRQEDLVALAVHDVYAETHSALANADTDEKTRTAKRVVLREGSDSQDHRFTSFALNRSCSVITPQFSVQSLGDASRATGGLRTSYHILHEGSRAENKTEEVEQAHPEPDQRVL